MFVAFYALILDLFAAPQMLNFTPYWGGPAPPGVPVILTLKRRLQVGLPAVCTGSLDRVIGSGCLNTSLNADNVLDCKFRTSAFYKVVWQHRSCEVGSEYTL